MIIPSLDTPHVREGFAHPAEARRLLSEGEILLDGKPWRVKLIERLAFADHLRFVAVIP